MKNNHLILTLILLSQGALSHHIHGGGKKGCGPDQKQKAVVTTEVKVPDIQDAIMPESLPLPTHQSPRKQLSQSPGAVSPKALAQDSLVHQLLTPPESSNPKRSDMNVDGQHSVNALNVSDEHAPSDPLLVVKNDPTQDLLSQPKLQSPIHESLIKASPKFSPKVSVNHPSKAHDLMDDQGAILASPKGSIAAQEEPAAEQIMRSLQSVRSSQSAKDILREQNPQFQAQLLSDHTPSDSHSVNDHRNELHHDLEAVSTSHKRQVDAQRLKESQEIHSQEEEPVAFVPGSSFEIHQKKHTEHHEEEEIRSQSSHRRLSHPRATFQQQQLQSHRGVRDQAHERNSDVDHIFEHHQAQQLHPMAQLAAQPIYYQGPDRDPYAHRFHGAEYRHDMGHSQPMSHGAMYHDAMHQEMGAHAQHSDQDIHSERSVHNKSHHSSSQARHKSRTHSTTKHHNAALDMVSQESKVSAHQKQEAIDLNAVDIYQDQKPKVIITETTPKAVVSSTAAVITPAASGAQPKANTIVQEKGSSSQKRKPRKNAKSSAKNTGQTKKLSKKLIKKSKKNNRKSSKSGLFRKNGLQKKNRRKFKKA